MLIHEAADKPILDIRQRLCQGHLLASNFVKFLFLARPFHLSEDSICKLWRKFTIKNAHILAQLWCNTAVLEARNIRFQKKMSL